MIYNKISFSLNKEKITSELMARLEKEFNAKIEDPVPTSSLLFVRVSNLHNAFVDSKGATLTLFDKEDKIHTLFISFKFIYNVREITLYFKD